LNRRIVSSSKPPSPPYLRGLHRRRAMLLCLSGLALNLPIPASRGPKNRRPFPSKRMAVHLQTRSD
jgi:hypothetical protein